MAGYVRQSTYTDGDVIQASDSNNEFSALLDAFNNSTGHAHDGTTAEGPVIGLIGDAGITTPLNKIEVDTVNDRLSFYVDVASTGVEQLRIEDGIAYPVTNNDIDLGTSVYMFKDGYFAGTLESVNLQATNIKANDGTASASIADSTGVFTITSAVLTTADINGGTVDNTVIGATTPLAGSFTALSATGNITVGGTVDGRDVAADGVKLDGIDTLLNQGVNTTDSPTFVTVNSTTLDTTNIEVTNIKAKDGTASATIADSTGVMTIPSAVIASAGILGGGIDNTVIGSVSPAAATVTTLNATGGGSLTGTWSDLGSVSTVDINGGTVDGTVIGGTSAAAGSFTTLSASGAFTADLSSITSSGDLAVADGGTGASTAAAARTNLDVDQAGTALALAIALG